MAFDPLRVIDWMDIHCHFSPPDVNTEQTRWHAMCSRGWKLDAPFRWSLEGTLDYMDRRGITMQMLSSIPQDHDALKQPNDYAASLVKRFPDRFGLLVAVPTDNRFSALVEVERATKELSSDGFAMTCCYNGTYLSDSALEPLWARLDEVSAVVFVHPNAYADASFGRPAAVLEVAFEPARTVVDMLYNGIFQRYPKIKFVLAHCGGALPALSGRLALLGTQSWVPNPTCLTREDMRNQLSKLFLDTAATATSHSLGAALCMVAPDHLVYGSDSGVPCSTEVTVDENLQSLLSYTGLTRRQIHEAGTFNMHKLFPLAAARLRGLLEETA